MPLQAANVSTFVVKYNKFNWKIAHSKVIKNFLNFKVGQAFWNSSACSHCKTSEDLILWQVCSSKYLKTEDDYIKDDFGEGYFNSNLFIIRFGAEHVLCSNNDDEDGSSFLVTRARKTIRDNSNEEEVYYMISNLQGFLLCCVFLTCIFPELAGRWFFLLKCSLHNESNLPDHLFSATYCWAVALSPNPRCVFCRLSFLDSSLSGLIANYCFRCSTEIDNKSGRTCGVAVYCKLPQTEVAKSQALMPLPTHAYPFLLVVSSRKHSARMFS